MNKRNSPIRIPSATLASKRTSKAIKARDRETKAAIRMSWREELIAIRDLIKRNITEGKFSAEYCPVLDHLRYSEKTALLDGLSNKLIKHGYEVVNRAGGIEIYW